MDKLINNNTFPKRAYCLYRVSTLGQVEKDDIPMQKQCCREFAEAQGWTIVKEFSEKGISGFKVSAKDRDAIQHIQQDAVAGKFDILLVFMFDRLGRRDDETPFVVEWFVKNGIEVWSAMEGQQRFDSHVDKLMNYIRYWQASGESLKTSVRVKTRLSQLTEEGLYTGGSIPFGYKLEKKGRVNKRNREVFDLAVDENEAEIIRLIFHKYVNEGYGAQRLCRFLHDNGIKSRDGKGFPNTSLNRIIKNVMYTGIIKNGDSQSQYIDELRIIDDDVFAQAQEIMRQRTQPHSSIPLNCKGKSLLVGNIYCAHCGNRLTLTTSGRNKKMPDGTIQKEVRMRYQCHYNVRHPGECDGQSGYSVNKVDGIVDQLVRMKFSEIAAASESEILSSQHEKDIELARSKCEMAKKYLLDKQKELDDYKSETLKVIRGQSKLSIDLLNTLVAEAESQIQEAQASAETAETELQELLETSEGLKREYDQLLSWADLYDKSSFEAKKMIVSQFIRSVRVGRDYNIEVDFNVSFEELQSYRADNPGHDKMQAPESRTA
ncbi:MAG: recombinase family protein [Oscillospiraceae bacterium]|nr:recombinase family protein [Oscillospiraceae bacterium]